MDARILVRVTRGSRGPGFKSRQPDVEVSGHGERPRLTGRSDSRDGDPLLPVSDERQTSDRTSDLRLGTGFTFLCDAEPAAFFDIQRDHPDGNTGWSHVIEPHRANRSQPNPLCVKGAVLASIEAREVDPASAAEGA